MQVFDTVVNIKDALRNKLIFKLDARLPIAVVLGFVAHRNEVFYLTQRLSHGTRAYIYNANGLPGFLSPTICVYLGQPVSKLTEDK